MRARRFRHAAVSLLCGLVAATLSIAQDAIPFGIGQGQQGAAQGSGEEWTPASLPSLWAWYDASTFTTDGSTKDGSNNVTKWVNKQGTTARDLTGVAATPLWTSAGVNGLDAVFFNRTDGDILYRDVTPPSAPFHVFLVLQVDNVLTNNQTAWWAGAAALDNDNFWDLIHGTSGDDNLSFRVDVVGSATTAVKPAGVLSSDTTYLYEIRETTSVDHGVLFDAGTEATNTAADKAPTPDRIALGGQADSAPTNGFQGFICEVVWSSAIVSGGDLTALRAYLDAKWGIPGL